MLVDHIRGYYGTNDVDFVISAHPDGDHINAVGVVMRELNVSNLLIHRPALHGHPSNSGSRPAEELVTLAQRQGASVTEPFQGVSGYGGSLLIAGPTAPFYEEMLRAQTLSAKSASPPRVLAGVLAGIRRAIERFPIERHFDDAGGTKPRNISAAIVSLMIDGQHMLFPSDAGVPAITQALAYLELKDRHGRGRRSSSCRTTAVATTWTLQRSTECSGATLATSTATPWRASVRRLRTRRRALPMPAGRRGYPVVQTSGSALRCSSAGAPVRPGWTTAVSLPPLAETDHDS